MRTRPLMWRLYPSYLAITLAAVLAVTWHATSVLKRFHVQQVQRDLAMLLRAWGDEAARRLPPHDPSAANALCAELAANTGVRITLLQGGDPVTVLGDSEPSAGDDPATCPAVAEAVAGRPGQTLREERLRGDDVACATLPLAAAGQQGWILRGAVSLRPVTQQLRGLYVRIAAGSVLVVLVSALAAWYAAQRISRPLKTLQAGAARFAQGGLRHRLPTDATSEIAALAASMNEMAAQLDEKINIAVRQRNERDAILTSMVEGVLAVDSQQRVLSMNRSAAALLGVQAAAVLGRSLEEAVRSPQLQKLVREVLQQQASVSDDFVLYTDTERFLHVQGTVLRDAAGALIGALVVIYDVTQIKRLENVRRDFVANVSHELKTPITSIKGYVETLLDGAMHDPEDAARFLKIVATQSDRLNAIIDDLLALSRVEQKAEQAEIALDRDVIRPVLESAIEVSQAKAAECGVRLDLQCDAVLTARINAPLLEQAVANLIHNACKHSPVGATVWVGAEQQGAEVVICVRDVGCGIEAHHLPRLFERFYRVDKSRSRKLGGTGLGLAIVKHIAQAHHGQVNVESTPNVGSLFSISLPA